MKIPLVSIIVPIYNVETYLDACLNSIKQQTYQNLEIIAVEDCSTDNSYKLLERHFNDARIKLIQHEKNSGLSAARNSGIKAASGEYMMFVDSDDIIDSYLIENCVKSALETNADLITYGFTPFEDSIANNELPYPIPHLQSIASPLNNNKYLNLPHFAWLKFIKSDVVKTADLKFPVGLYYEDWPFHWQLGLSAMKKYELPVNFYLYRQRKTSITGSTNKKLLDLFTIHSLVMSVIEKREAYNVKTLLANKIKQSHWSVLTRIDDELLTIALEKAKKADKDMRLNKYKNDFSIKNLIINFILRSPKSISILTLKTLRTALFSKRKFATK